MRGMLKFIILSEIVKISLTEALLRILILTFASFMSRKTCMMEGSLPRSMRLLDPLALRRFESLITCSLSEA